MKRIVLSEHAVHRLATRGTNEEEVHRAVLEGLREPAKGNRWMCRLNYQYESEWQGKYYTIKQVAPIIIEKPEEITVITVYTFFF